MPKIYYHIYIIPQKTENVKRKMEKFFNIAKNSIFIDEKIYSVDRLKKIKEQKATNGFTYSKVWQNRT